MSTPPPPSGYARSSQVLRSSLFLTLMSTPPPPSGYARSSQVLRSSCFLFLVLRSESTSIYLWGPSWRDVEPFPSARPSCGHFSIAHYATIRFAVRDWNALVNVSATRAAIYFLAEWKPLCGWSSTQALSGTSDSLVRRVLLVRWGSAEEFPIASESPWGWALSRFPSTIQTESASVIHKGVTLCQPHTGSKNGPSTEPPFRL
ncbi:hypothetical protein R3P38DRAFT_3167579 [Favolaschia claudopus]|uniref:Uncharacterized protein n=1 Tax=Favolaschia claudopus TaxID=2862362 RepID=A0AAW0E2Y5_9AGAR